MRCAPEHFEDQELVLVYIAKRLPEALRLEKALTEGGLDYVVEPDKYSGGIIFQSERTGAFFYVAPADQSAAEEILKSNGVRPYRPAE